MDKAALKARLKLQRIETPSWGYNDSGTRFGTFAQPWAAKTIEEKFEDAGTVHRLTGICPTVALHIPWDTCADWSAAKALAAKHGVTIGAINPNVFQDKDYQFGSICHRDPAIRKKAVKAHLDCIEIMKATGSDMLSLWFADGTNYPCQDDFRGRKRRLQESLAQVYAALPAHARMVLEYKFFEPAFYHTDVQDWGSSLLHCTKLGPKAQVLVDTGHHAQGTNIAYIVSFLLDEERLGGFHFNARRYADDDLIVGSANPFELFEIYVELVAAGDKAKDVAYMIDQSHNIEPKLEAMLHSVLNCQTAYAKALIVPRGRLAELQNNGDVLGGHRVLVDAFETDIRPLLMQVREEMGVPTDPMAAYLADGYAAKVAAERGIAKSGGGGIQS